MSTPQTHEPVVVEALSVRRNRVVMTLAALPLVLSAVLPVLFDPVFLGLVPHFALLGLVAVTYFWGRNPWPRYRPVEVRVEEAWLQVGNRRVGRDQIRQADIVPDGDGARLRLQRGRLRPAIELRCLGEPDARTLARRLGLDASQTVASFRTMSRLQATPARRVGAQLGAVYGTVLLAVLGGMLLGPAVLVALLIGLVGLLVLRVAPTRVEVGTDGVLMRWLGTRRFLRHDEIEATYLDGSDFSAGEPKLVCLRLRSGEQVRIPVASLRWDFGRTEALRSRIEQAGAAHARGEAASPVPVLLRGGRSPRQWVAELRACSVRLQHRVAAVMPEQLWLLIEDSTGSELVRAAAAVALGANLPPAERQRIAMVGKGTVSPRLRVALDAVATGADEEAIAEALGELEAAEADRERAGR